MAHSKETVPVRAQPCVRSILLLGRHDDPVDAEVTMEPLKIGGLKISPAVLCVHFFQPARGEAWNACGHASIFYVVSQGAAFGERAKAVVVLAWHFDIVRIEGKQAVDRSVLADPGECL